MHHDELDGTGRYSHVEVDTYLENAVLAYDECSSDTLSMTANVFQDITGATVTFEAPFSGTAYVNALSSCRNSTGSTAVLTMIVLNGASEVGRGLATLENGYYGCLSAIGSFSITRGTSYTVKMQGRSGVTGSCDFGLEGRIIMHGIRG